MGFLSKENLSSLMSSLGGLPDELPWQQAPPSPTHQLQGIELTETAEGLD